MISVYQEERLKEMRTYPKMREIGVFIRKFSREHGYAPSYRDLQEGCNISSTSVVQFYLNKMRGEGLLFYANGVSRTVRLTDDGKKILNA
jgi:repressor LexA|tara:strand:- start:553 stop:822 length:270 start_codon:yes stop_codon:yes gene_type:complete